MSKSIVIKFKNFPIGPNLTANKDHLCDHPYICRHIKTLSALHVPERTTRLSYRTSKQQHSLLLYIQTDRVYQHVILHYAYWPTADNRRTHTETQCELWHLDAAHWIFTLRHFKLVLWSHTDRTCKFRWDAHSSQVTYDLRGFNIAPFYACIHVCMYK